MLGCLTWAWDDCGVDDIPWDGRLGIAVPTKDICCWFRFSIDNDVEARSTRTGVGGTDPWGFLGDNGEEFVVWLELSFVPPIRLTCNILSNSIHVSVVERYGAGIVVVGGFCCTELVVAAVTWDKRPCDEERGGTEDGLGPVRSLTELFAQTYLTYLCRNAVSSVRNLSTKEVANELIILSLRHLIKSWGFFWRFRFDWIDE